MSDGMVERPHKPLDENAHISVRDQLFGRLCIMQTLGQIAYGDVYTLPPSEFAKLQRCMMKSDLDEYTVAGCIVRGSI